MMANGQHWGGAACQDPCRNLMIITKFRMLSFAISIELVRLIIMKEVEFERFDSNTMKEETMEKKFFIRGYREKAPFPSLYDDEGYSLDEAISKARGYFRKMRVITKIKIYESKPYEKKAATVTLTDKWLVNGDYDNW
jgi:hypothetical protein